MQFLSVIPLFVQALFPAVGSAAEMPVMDTPPVIQTPEPDPGITPVPGPSPAPEAPGSGSTSVITQIFEVVFSADSLSDALSNALEAAARDEVEQLDAHTAQVSGLLTGIIKPPQSGRYAELANSTLTTAAALAPALYLVRLALYHWGRIADDRDSLLSVFSDWTAAGFLAVSAGPFLDLVVQAGWWMAGAALGETQQLALQFLSVSTVSNTFAVLAQPEPSIFTGVFAIAAGLGGLGGVIGLAASFAISQAVLFVLGTLAPVVAVLSVIPQMRWTRGIWLKAVAVLALIPVAAGGIFKAGVSLAAFFTGAGPVDLIIRLFWLWGAVGFMLSMAGILGRVTLSTAADTTRRIGGGVRQIVSSAVLVTQGFSGAAPAAAAASPGGAAAPSAQASGGSTSETTVSGGTTGVGRTGPPMFDPAKRAGPVQPAPTSPPMHSPNNAQTSIDPLEPHFRAAALDPAEIRQAYPDEMDRIRSAYTLHREQIEASPEPLREAARIGNAAQVLAQMDRAAGGEDHA